VPIRKAEFVIYTEPDIIDKLGYIDSVKAICVLNKCILVFTIKEQFAWFGNPKYKYNITLSSVLTGRLYGYNITNTFDEALDICKNFVTSYFPLADIIDDNNVVPDSKQ